MKNGDPNNNDEVDLSALLHGFSGNADAAVNLSYNAGTNQTSLSIPDVDHAVVLFSGNITAVRILYEDANGHTKSADIS